MQANAVSLSAELPQIEGGTQKVLYPSSAKAGSDLQVGSSRNCIFNSKCVTSNLLELQRLFVYVLFLLQECHADCHM